MLPPYGPPTRIFSERANSLNRASHSSQASGVKPSRSEITGADAEVGNMDWSGGVGCEEDGVSEVWQEVVGCDASGS